jgi:hypothetical protein
MFNETKVLFPRASVTSADVGSSVIKLFVLPAPVIFIHIDQSDNTFTSDTDLHF